MSRSVKKQPVCNDATTPGTIWAKRQAAKAVRRYHSGVSDGKWYRKLYCSWNICDYSSYQTKQQAIKEWETADWRRHRCPTLAGAIQDWHRYYRRK
ncbi:hypothetical protein [Paenibacillus camerounensis]|uniref:hypothetical protein n=1 Tax=Paenibacillus camerounensis TaxID=1243663 RepID=UPI0005A684A0|nr:hypothetical protein [Paenibacillus camerounensis]